MWQQSGARDMVLLEAVRSPEEMETLCARVIDEASNGVKVGTVDDCGVVGETRARGKEEEKEEGKSDVESGPQSSPLAFSTPVRKSGRKEKGEGEREAEDALENNTDFVPIGPSSSGESTRSDTDAPDRITEVNQHSSGGSHRSDRTSPFTGGTSGDAGKVERPTAAEEDTSSESTSTNGIENRSGEEGPDVVVASPTSAEGGVLPVAVLTCGMSALCPRWLTSLSSTQIIPRENGNRRSRGDAPGDIFGD